jgi:putative membrane protein
MDVTTASAFIPYCGRAPLPGHALWNADPVLGGALLAMLGIYFWGAASPRLALGRWEKGLFAAGWAALALALLSPLCNLSVALFTARSGQHLIIAFAAAPLMILGRGDLALREAIRLLNGREPHPVQETGEAGLILYPAFFAAIFWFWHSGPPYDAALQNNAIYWAMELSIIVSSLLLWRALFNAGPARVAGVIIASVLTGFQMSVLGALLTLSSRPWYSAHETTAWPFGLTPLQDQQLGGAMMWAVGGLLLTGFTLYAMSALFAEEAEAPARDNIASR